MNAILLLASSSPRRRQLLEAAGIPFELLEPGPEPDAAGAPGERAVLRARSKATGAGVPPGSGLPVLGVDTVVDVGGREFGKPGDRAEAEVMLRALAGRVHRVHTAHCLFDPGSGALHEELASAEVSCREPTGPELQRYLDSGDWRGKAGAYGIQDPGATFLRLEHGAFDTVVGLHVAAVRRLLARLARRPT